MDYGWYPPAGRQPIAASQRDEVEVLKDQAEYLKRSLDTISARIAELEKEPTD
jgi:hypothetical protein